MVNSVDDKTNNKKKKTVITLIIIVLIIVLLIGIAYAFFRAEKDTTHEITTRLINIEYQDGDIINAEKLIPLKNDEIDEKSTTITFNVVSNDVDIVYYDIKIDDIDAPLGLRNTCFKWRLYETTSSEDVLLNEGDFNGVTTEKIMVKDQIIEAQTTKNYKLQIWLAETDEDQGELINKTFKGKVSIDARDRLLNKRSGEIVVINDSRNGEVPNLKIYGKTDENNKSVGEDGTINLQVTQNLVTNGLGEYKNTLFFDNNSIGEHNIYFRYSEEKYKSLGSFINRNQGMSTNTFPIDASKKYIFSFYTRHNEDTSNNFTIASYDIDGNGISREYFISDDYNVSYTTLAKDLNDGDEVIYFKDIRKFSPDDIDCNEVHYIFWNYKDSTGHLYPEYVYSRNWNRNKNIQCKSVDYENNSIKLKEPWENGNYERGTKVSEGIRYSGNSIYINYQVTKDWTLIKKEIVSKTSITDKEWDKLPFGAKSVSVRPIYSVIYDHADHDHQFSRVIFGEEDKYEVPISLKDHEPQRRSGDVADYIDYNKKQIVRKIGSDGSILPNETTESIELPTIPTYDGNTIIETTDSIMPEIEVKY